jgi:hypothetical protein
MFVFMDVYVYIDVNSSLTWWQVEQSCWPLTEAAVRLKRTVMRYFMLRLLRND